MLHFSRAASWLRGLLLVVLLATPALVMAAEQPVLYRGARLLGMGGAFTAVADDENAIFVNPAGLARRSGWGFKLDLLPQVEISEQAFQVFADISGALNTSDESERTGELVDVLTANTGEPFHIGLRSFNYLLIPNLKLFRLRIPTVGIGLLGQAVASGQLHNPLSSTVVDIGGGGDVGVLSSVATSWMDDQLQVGGTLKVINRQSLIRSFSMRELIDQETDITKDLKSGTGVGFDLGVLYEPPTPWRFLQVLHPTVGVVYQNIGNTDLQEAGQLPEQINVGVAVQPAVGFGTLTGALDVQDIAYMTGTDNDFQKRFHFGAEYAFPKILGVRAGINQAYWTAGLTLNLWILKLSYATYAEELGAYAGQLGDRRHVANIDFLFIF